MDLAERPIGCPRVPAMLMFRGERLASLISDIQLLEALQTLIRTARGSISLYICSKSSIDSREAQKLNGLARNTTSGGLLFYGSLVPFGCARDGLTCEFEASTAPTLSVPPSPAPAVMKICFRTERAADLAVVCLVARTSPTVTVFLARAPPCRFFDADMVGRH